MITRVRADQVKKNDFLQVSKYFARKTGKVFHEVISSDYRWFKIEVVLKDVEKLYKINRKTWVMVDRVDIEKEIEEAREKVLRTEIGRYFDFVDYFKVQGSWVCDCLNINVWTEEKCTCGLDKPLLIRCKKRV